jgi:hypothetical protein
MGRKSVIIIATAVLLGAALVVAAAYLYDRSQDGKIAEGVTIDGIDVGGMNAEEAEAKARREMSIPDVEELYDQVEVGTPIFIG